MTHNGEIILSQVYQAQQYMEKATLVGLTTGVGKKLTDLV